MWIAEALGKLASTQASALFITILIALLLGMFLDTTSILIMTAPIVIPLAGAVGLDPVHFGLVYVFALMIGLITPPIGICIYPVCEYAGITLVQFVRRVWPFYLVLVICLVFIAAFPPLVTWFSSRV
jgi:TRAP-type C4-dicarboxylate transport system permease large subunit